MNQNDAKSPSKKLVTLSIGCVLICIAAFNVGAFFSIVELIDFYSGMKSLDPVLSVRSVIVPLIIGSLSLDLVVLAGAYQTVARKRGDPKILKWVQVGVTGCLIATGSVLVNPLQHSLMKKNSIEAGYKPCSQYVSWKWMTFRAKYVLDPTDCDKD